MIIFNSIVVFFIIMSLAGTSGLFSERSGTVNIGINGMMIVGTVVYFLVGKALPVAPAYQLISMFAAVASGVLTGILFGFTSITLKANQTIAGTAINLLAAAIGALLVAKTTLDKSNLPSLTWGASTNKTEFTYMFNIIFFVGVIVLVGAFVLLKYTSFGMRLKAAGENPQALDSQGVNVIRMRYYGIMISGAIAGLAGAFFMQNAVTFKGNVEGLGFIGLAILIAGQWRIHWVVLVALVFSVIYSVAQNITTIELSLSQYQDVLKTLPFILSLVFLAIFSKRSKAPKAAGIPYDKSQR